jgi:tight adherence protein C
MMIVAVLAAFGLAGGVWLIGSTIWPARRVPVLTTTRTVTTSASYGRPIQSTSWAGRWIVARFAGRLHTSGLRADFVLTGQPVELTAAGMATGAVYGLIAGAVFPTLWRAMGIPIPTIVIVVTAISAAVFGAAAPGLSVRRTAITARTDFVATLSAYLDVLILLIASGMGTEAAMVTAANTGTGPSFQLLQRAARRTQHGSTTIWRAFNDLADEINVPELAELAAAGLLAGEQGAALRAALTAKSATLRDAALAAERADGHRRSSAMFGPIVLIAVGAIVFILGMLLLSIQLT